MSRLPSRRDLALSALRAALDVRASAQVPFSTPLGVFDLAEGLGLELRFVDIGSLEGMYLVGSPPRILISADRPPGRQAFTCGHELGHHFFQHGTRLDELVTGAAKTGRSTPEEFIADAFAGYLLMPKAAVVAGFRMRNWDPRSLNPEHCYIVAGWLGVGYAALVSHMVHSLQMISASQATQLGKVSLPHVRSSLAGRDIARDLIVVDDAWTNRPVDLRVGDCLLAEGGTQADGAILQLDDNGESKVILSAKRPGCARLHNKLTGQTLFVRISRTPYIGLARFRHLEEPDDE